MRDYIFTGNLKSIANNWLASMIAALSLLQSRPSCFPDPQALFCHRDLPGFENLAGLTTRPLNFSVYAAAFLEFFMFCPI
jgi:hypothetical protein